MKKGFGIAVFLSIILLSFVSAGFFSDLFRITGKVIDNCTDTDGGENIYVKGIVNSVYEDGCYTGGAYGRVDFCTNCTVMENFCGDSDGVEPFDNSTTLVREIPCPYGCSNGACFSEPTPLCTDSDGGINYAVKGSVKDYRGTNYDECFNIISLHELFCENGKYEVNKYNCPNSCVDGACVTTPPPTNTANLTCADSDGGLKIYTSGRAYYTQNTSNSMNDTCIEEYYVREAYCERGVIESIPYYCNYGCLGGKCLQASQTNDSITNCTDSDGGKNYYLKGSINTSYINIISTDKCSPDGVLLEYFCSSVVTTGPVTELQVYVCPEGCLDGACIRKTFACGDGVKDEGEQCDGNYSTVNMSCSSFGYDLGVLGCTDNCTLDFSKCTQKMCLNGLACQDGYICVDGICIKDRKGGCENYCDLYCSNGYVEGSCNCECKPYPVQGMCNKSGGVWKVFSNGCGDSCDFARNTRNITCTQVITEGCDCGPNMCWTGGVCEKTNISTTNITCKSSCLLNDICYPLGYRKSGKYCAEGFVFLTELRSNEACSNNFECKSNLCVNDQCVSQSVLKKFLSWFKRHPSK